MSCFDTFVGEINCIKCGKEFKFFEQTKDFDCCMKDFLLGDYICDKDRSFFYPFTATCPNCGETQDWVVAIKNGQIVSYFTKERAKEKDLLKKLKNIEKNYKRNAEYRSRALLFLGEDTKNTTVCFDEDKICTLDIQIGKFVTVFDEDWYIDCIFKQVLNTKEDEPELTSIAEGFLKGMQQKTLLCKVHNKDYVERLLVLIDLYHPILKRPEIKEYDGSDYSSNDAIYVIPKHYHLVMLT